MADRPTELKYRWPLSWFANWILRKHYEDYMRTPQYDWRKTEDRILERQELLMKEIDKVAQLTSENRELKEKLAALSEKVDASK